MSRVPAFGPSHPDADGHTKRLTRDSAARAPRPRPRPAARPGNAWEHVAWRWPVDGRHRDSRLTATRSISARAPSAARWSSLTRRGQRAPSECAEGEQLPLLALTKKRDAQQRPPLHQIHVHAHVQRARRARNRTAFSSRSRSPSSKSELRSSGMCLNDSSGYAVRNPNRRRLMISPRTIGVAASPVVAANVQQSRIMRFASSTKRTVVGSSSDRKNPAVCAS